MREFRYASWLGCLVTLFVTIARPSKEWPRHHESRKNEPHTVGNISFKDDSAISISQHIV